MSIEKLRPSFAFDADRVEQLKEIAPEAFADGKINWETLREALGEYLEEEEGEAEHFGLFWPGKREARKLASLPSEGALVPVPKQGVNEESTRNVFIEGENLEVLKLLLKSYAGRVKMIYLDPPFNTGSDLVYRDDFREPLEAYLRRTGQMDEKGVLLTTNTKASGRFHSNWLSMMYPRLRIARQLLEKDGVIFVSIDDNEMHNLRSLMNEVFGEENALPTLVWNTGHSQQQGIFKEYHQYIVPYARSSASRGPFGGGEGVIVAGAMKKISKANPASDFCFPAGTRCEAGDGTEFTGTWGETETVTLVEGRFVAEDSKLREPVTLRAGWTQPNQMAKYFAGEEVSDTRGQLVTEFYFSGTGKLKCTKERSRVTPSTILEGYGTQSRATEELGALFGGAAPLDYPKPVGLMKDLVSWMTADQDDSVILDFFAGSCTTGHAVLELNRETRGRRRFICVQLPEQVDESTNAGKTALAVGLETVSEIGKERLRRVTARMQAEEEGRLDAEADEDLGFKCYRLDRSSFRRWEDYEGQSIAEILSRFDEFETPLVEGWREADLLVEILLTEGFPLDSSVARQLALTENTVKLVGSDLCEHRLFVCLDEVMSDRTVQGLAPGPEDVVVCLDSALTDEMKMRLGDVCNLHVIEGYSG